MSRFQSHFKRALMFCVLAPAFAQYPCLAQSSNETAGQPVGAENLQVTPTAINNFVETSSTAAEPFAAANLPWLNDIFATEESPINPTKFALDGASAAASSTSLGNSDPQSTAQSANGQTSGINKNYVLRGSDGNTYPLMSALGLNDSRNGWFRWAYHAVTMLRAGPRMLRLQPFFA
jgi:hypothetical protein